MPQVPGYGQPQPTPQAPSPQPNQIDLLMALAEMHSNGRLYEPKPKANP